MEHNVHYFSSPAKINLFLHICGRREDGYHNLQTLFQLLDQGDRIGLRLTNTNKITLINSIDAVEYKDNLIVKAAELLLPYRQSQQLGIDVFIDKNLPMGGGLGGGSSNAATMLMALNIVWGCKLSQSNLMKLGLSLGADVPVFINGHTAFAQGVGETLFNTQQPDKVFLVVTPKVHVSTKTIFTHKDLPRNTQILDFSRYTFEDTHNDCEKLVCELHPEVANLLDRLINYAPSRMTGTGSSVFAMFDTQQQAKNAIKHLPDYASAIVANGINVSPLISELAQVKSHFENKF